MLHNFNLSPLSTFAVYDDTESIQFVVGEFNLQYVNR